MMSVVVFVVEGHEDVTVALFPDLKNKTFTFAFSVETLALSRGFGKLLLLCLRVCCCLFFFFFLLVGHIHAHTEKIAVRCARALK